MQAIRETSFLIVLALFWIGTMVLGVALDSGVYFQKLANENLAFIERVSALITIIFTYTWSNIFLLCCLAALIGEIGRVANLGENPKIKLAIIRGFFIFLLVTGGQLIIAGNISLPANVAPEGGAVGPMVTSVGQYFRLASFCSLMAFLVGFTPSWFDALLDRLKRVSSAADQG